MVAKILVHVMESMWQCNRLNLVAKVAAAFEAPSQTKEELCANDTSRHPKVFKLGPELGYQ